MPDINKSYSWAIDTCNAPNVRYNIDYRDQQRDPEGNICYDCSSFIWYALKAGFFENIGSMAFDTASMPYFLPSAGFVEINKNSEWKKGDIVWRSKEYTQQYVNPNAVYGHTEMVYEGGNGMGITMGAHGKTGYSPADQVAINTFYSSAEKYEKLYRYGEGADGSGYSLYVISAILGNFYQESQINPGVWENNASGKTWTDLRVGYGLGQWTNTQGNTHGRLYQLHEYLNQNGYADDSGEGEIAFLIDEDTWNMSTQPTDYASLTDFLESTSTNLTSLTTQWYNQWEGMNQDDGTLSYRIQMANYFFNYLSANANNTSVTGWISGNRYLSMNESENNAIMFYRTLGSGGGGGGNEHKHSMPVWMMILNRLKMR